jgi:hypothetical protein
MFNLPKVFHKYRNERTGIYILFLTWVISNIIAYFYFGIMISVDSELYIDNANSITIGDWPQNREFFYSAYSSIIAVLIFFRLKVTWIVLFQIIISGMAIISIYKITQRISKNNIAPFIACSLYLLWYEFQQWNLIVYTDSLFANSVVIAVFLLISAKNKRGYFFATILITFVVLIRPTGVGFLIAILGYILYDIIHLNREKPIFNVLVLILFFGFSLIILNEVLRGFITSFMYSYANAEIIYPKISIGIEKPEGLDLPNDTFQPLIQLMLFIIRNPYYMVKISIIKGLLFLAHIKPYYSLLHNVFIACFLYPIYYFTIQGFKSISKNKINVFTVVFLVFQFLAISLTSENWDGRFLLPILPWIFIYASIGISQIFYLSGREIPITIAKKP